LVDAGVVVTVSTDDTFLFGNSLAEEYYALSQALGFSNAELVQVARNGVKTALLDDAKRSAIETELDDLLADLSPECDR
jgi:adenosine deaminase